MTDYTDDEIENNIIRPVELAKEIVKEKNNPKFIKIDREIKCCFANKCECGKYKELDRAFCYKCSGEK